MTAAIIYIASQCEIRLAPCEISHCDVIFSVSPKVISAFSGLIIVTDFVQSFERVNIFAVNEDFEVKVVLVADFDGDMTE